MLKVEPIAYLGEVLDRVSTNPVSRIEELLPPQMGAGCQCNDKTNWPQGLLIGVRDPAIPSAGRRKCG